MHLNSFEPQPVRCTTISMLKLFTKTAWSLPRIVYAVLSTVFILLVIFGVYLVVSGAGAVHAADNTKTPEDWSGVIGSFAELLGFGLIFVSSVLSLFFGGLYLHVTRRLQQIHLATKN